MSGNSASANQGLALRHLSVEEATELAVRTWIALGLSPEDAEIAADHLVDAELRGYVPMGLSKLMSFKDTLAGWDLGTPEVLRETAQTAVVDAHAAVGYIAGYRATELAVAKAKATGFGLVTAFNTQGTGALSYYCEMATRERLVAIVASNISGTGLPEGRRDGDGGVAPYGAFAPLLGTNPLAFGFPTDHEPIVVDISTSSITIGDVLRRGKLGLDLPEGVAVDSAGRPTISPEAAMDGGALLTWGGPRGFGLAAAVQLLGMLCGSPDTIKGIGFFVLVFDPSLLMSVDTFTARATDFAARIRASTPADGHQQVRMPFDRSVAERGERRLNGIDVPEKVYEGLQEIIASAAQ